RGRRGLREAAKSAPFLAPASGLVGCRMPGLLSGCKRSVGSRGAGAGAGGERLLPLPDVEAPVETRDRSQRSAASRSLHVEKAMPSKGSEFEEGSQAHPLAPGCFHLQANAFYLRYLSASKSRCFAQLGLREALS